MQAVRRWIRSALHPAEHALEASSWSSHGVRFRGMGESKSPPPELGLQNGYYSSTRKDAAERAVMADLAHSAEALQDPSLRFETSRTD